jgi:hypothetical protein
MIQAHCYLTRAALARGYGVSVWDGEDYSPTLWDFWDVMKVVNSVDSSTLRIADTSGNWIGSALVEPGLEPDETIVDYVYPDGSEWIDLVMNQYWFGPSEESDIVY